MTTEVAAGALVKAIDDVQLLATSIEAPSVEASVDGGGFVGIGTETASATATHTTNVEVYGEVKAGRTAFVEARDGFDGYGLATASAGGLGASTTANQLLYTSGQTAAILGGKMTAQLIYLSGQEGLEHSVDPETGEVLVGRMGPEVTPVQINEHYGLLVNSSAAAESSAFGANATATSEFNINNNALVQLQPNAELTAATVQIHAREEKQHFNLTSNADCSCFAGEATSHSELGDSTGGSRVSGDAGSLIRTGALLVDTFQELTQNLSQDSHGGFLVGHYGCTEDNGNCTGGGEQTNSEHLNLARDIDWNSTVILLSDADPLLEVNKSGEIVAKSANVKVYEDSSSEPERQIGYTFKPGQTIVVAPIFNEGVSAALFVANQISGQASTIESSNGPGDEPAQFIIQYTWDSVRIVNEANLSMLMEGKGGPALSINTLDENATSSSTGAINISVEKGDTPAENKFDFGVKQLFTPTEVLVESIRGPPSAPIYNITFQGGISDIIGKTTLINERGDIVVDTEGPFTSNKLYVTATEGSVGCATDDQECKTSKPLDAILIDYATGPTGSPSPKTFEVEGTAFEDLHLNLTVVRRTSATKSTAPLEPKIGTLRAGRNLVVNVEDSYEQVTPEKDGPGVTVDGFHPAEVPTFPKSTFAPYEYSGGTAFESKTVVRHYQPDSGSAWICSEAKESCGEDAYILLAFSHGTKELLDSAYDFTNVEAAGDIDIRHESTKTDITLKVISFSDQFTYKEGTYGAEENAGRVDLYTNGSIIDSASSGNLRVGQIFATGICEGTEVLCTSEPIPANVTLYSPAAVVNAASDTHTPLETLTANNVIARNIKIVAGENLAKSTSGQGGVGTPNTFLLIEVNADGAGPSAEPENPEPEPLVGKLTVTDLVAAPVAVTLAGLKANLPPEGGGTYGVFITQTKENGHNGGARPQHRQDERRRLADDHRRSILDARMDGNGLTPAIEGEVLAPNVIADSVELDALLGSVGASREDTLKIYSGANLYSGKGGRVCEQRFTLGYQGADYQNASEEQRAVEANCYLAAQADESVFVTETPGAELAAEHVAAPMDVLLAWARDGEVWLTSTETGAATNQPAGSTEFAKPGNDILLIHAGNILVPEEDASGGVVVPKEGGSKGYLETHWGEGTLEATVPSPGAEATPYTPSSKHAETPYGLIEAQSGNVHLVSAENIVTDPYSQILATRTEEKEATSDPNTPTYLKGNVLINGNDHPAYKDPAGHSGEVIVLRGALIPGALTLKPNAQGGNGNLTQVFGTDEATR